MKQSPLKIIFAGTPHFAATILEALLRSQHEIVAVYTQPDRQAGRGQKMKPSPVKELALQHQLPFKQPTSLRSDEEVQILQTWQADLMVVVAYGLILPSQILAVPRLGCVNVHASLLPQWRGAAPIQRAILQGDEKTGVTIMQMDEGLDTGPMLYQQDCVITPTETSSTLHDKLAKLGAEALLQALTNFQTIIPKKQQNDQATYAHKIKKEEGKINWALSAVELERLVRAFNPWPVAFFGSTRVWKAEAISGDLQEQPGKIVHVSSEGIDVATGKGVLRLLELQFPGGRILPVKEFFHTRKNEFSEGRVLRESSHE